MCGDDNVGSAVAVASASACWFNGSSVTSISVSPFSMLSFCVFKH